MTVPEATHVMTAFGIVAGGPNNPNQITRIDKKTGDYAVANQPALAAAANTMAKLRDLLSFLDKGKPMFLRGDVLLAVNDVFGLALRTIADVNPLIADGQMSFKCIQLRKLAGPDKTHVRSYYQAAQNATAQQAPADVVARVVRLFLGIATVDVIGVLQAVHTSAGNTTRVTTASMPGLIRIRNAFPTGVFTGFTRWGPGDAPDAPTNFRNHFLKHVCDESQAYPDEAVFWWKALDIKVRVEDLVPQATQQELLFFNHDSSLNRQRIRDFIINVVYVRPALRAALFAAYGQAYSDYAFRLSGELNNIMVESDGTNRVLISGFTGHVAVFGRHDDANGPLGMSSCYFVVPAQRAVKLDVNKTTRIFAMRR